MNPNKQACTFLHNAFDERRYNTWFLPVIYVGGMDNIVLGTLHKYSSGFFGCIANFTLTTNVTTNIDVMADAEGGRNVAQCLTTIADNHYPHHHHHHHLHPVTTSGRWQ